jgi:hypothetical protein
MEWNEMRERYGMKWNGGTVWNEMESRNEMEWRNGMRER